jgi:hypothetical protein
MMRAVIDDQMKLGEVDISKIVFNSRSRDEIPQLLKGLQHIWCDHDFRQRVFDLLENHIKLSKTGRKGMDLWSILVFGTVRLNCNWDYDKLQEMADNHLKLREMVGVSPFDRQQEFPLQTLKDNVQLLTPALLIEINTLVVGAGHNLVKKKMLKY